MRKIFKFSLLAFILLCNSGCEDPEKRYFDEIVDRGFIPFKNPMGGVGTGSIVRGTPSNLLFVAPYYRCFPDEINGESTGLRWESDASLPTTHYESTVDFNAKLNTIVQAGTPAFTFKFDMEKIMKVDFEAKGAMVQFIDQISLYEFFQVGISETCKKYLMKYPFILQALRVSEMSFVFLDSFSGQVELSLDNIEQIVDIEVGVKWHIENSYKLVIQTPKFIGYHLAQLREQDEGFVNLISYEIEKDNFVWKEVGRDRGASSILLRADNHFSPNKLLREKVFRRQKEFESYRAYNIFNPSREWGTVLRVPVVSGLGIPK